MKKILLMVVLCLGGISASAQFSSYTVVNNTCVMQEVIFYFDDSNNNCSRGETCETIEAVGYSLAANSSTTISPNCSDAVLYKAEAIDGADVAVIYPTGCGTKVAHENNSCPPAGGNYVEWVQISSTVFHINLVTK